MTALNPAQALGNMPQGLREELLAEFAKATRNFREQRWEASELNGGRFSEVAYCICRGYVDGQYPPSAIKPRSLSESCKALEQTPKASAPQSVRIGIPRVLVGLYEIRNNRGVGHVGGEVDANHMDASYVLHATQWIMAEFVRLFNNADVATATSIVDALVDRTVPLIWKIGDRRRVLDTSLPLAEKTLLLLYGTPEPLLATSLAADLRQNRFSNYRDRILKKLQSRILIEYDAISGLVHLSPLGVREVEANILLPVSIV